MRISMHIIMDYEMSFDTDEHPDWDMEQWRAEAFKTLGRTSYKEIGENVSVTDVLTEQEWQALGINEQGAAE